jgi:hypothetical protein
MASSADGSYQDQAREIVPSDLLFVHEGLEEDGESWRAALPRPDHLLSRVVMRPLQALRQAAAMRSDIPASTSQSPAPRRRHRRPRR